MIDLHTHSVKSDGSYTPTKLVDYAVTKGLTAFALTDHDTIDGIEEAKAHADALRSLHKGEEVVIPEIIPGIEFSTEYHGRDIHIVGLDIDIHNQSFCKKLQDFIDSRDGRNKKMAEKLASVGIGISYEGLLSLFPDCVLTRAHFAKYLFEYGYVRSLKEAFDRYLGPDCPCYVPREKITPAQAVEQILSAGGIPVLAHPMIYHLENTKLETLVSELKEVGLIGIEAIYCTHSPSEERYVRSLAARMNLCISGGSDFHGDNKPGLDLGTGYGHLFVPDEVWTDLKTAKKNA